MVISAWFLLLIALPVLLAGELLVRHIGVFSRFNIPAPVVGGLVAAVLVLIGNLTGWVPISFSTQVTAQWWTWIVTIGPEWVKAPPKGISMPFLVAFFTCVGLNASWLLVKRGSVQVLLFLVLSCTLAVIQNCIGVGLAKAMGVSPLLGLVCGSITMTGGHGTALGFAPDLEKAGLEAAAVVGAAAATFGLVAGGLIGGPIGTGLIRRNKLHPAAPLATHLEGGDAAIPGILFDFRSIKGLGKPVLWHLLLLLVTIKLGSWASFFIQNTGITFPVYIGAMLVGLVVRNTFDLAGFSWVRTEIIDLLASVSLSFFLTMSMISLNLIELAATAVPMLGILSVQVCVMGLFAWFVTFRVMGKDYDAAVISSGHCGFGLGATPNAVANMKALVECFGPAPRAFLVVPIVGSFLIDLANATNITVFLNIFGPHGPMR